MSGSLSFLVMVERAGPAPQPLLWQLRKETQPGDRLVFLCNHDPKERNAAVEIKTFEEMEGFGPGINVEVVALAAPNGVAFETRLELGYAALREAEGPILTLDTGTRLEPNALAPLRAAVAGSDVPDLVQQRSGVDDPYLLPQLVIAPRLLRDPDRPRADGAGGTVALAQHFFAAASRVEQVAVPADLLPRLAEPGPRAARALTVLARQGQETLESVMSLLPALWQRATPGGRAAMMPILSEAGLIPPAAPASVPCIGRAPLKVWRGGPHAHRMPLAYPALQPLWKGRIMLVEDPGAADLLTIAHPLDALTLAPDAAGAVERGVPAALLSEEPFWDSLFSPDPMAARITLPAAHLGELRLHQINHHRSSIFDFEKIPYYLLTEHRFVSVYAARFARNARLLPEDWAAAWAARPRDIVFMAERRMEAFHDITLPEAGLVGLCAWRSRLAAGCKGDGVERLGASWSGGRTRFELPDWHFDKMIRLDGRTRLLSAIENTHQPLYLSEKLFDAFACGTVPVYMAAPGHAVERLNLPEESWVNLWGFDEAEIPSRLREVMASGIDWRAYAKAQRALAALFDRLDWVVKERERGGRALISELVAAAA